MRLFIIIFGLSTLLLGSTTAKEEQSTSFWDMILVIAQGKSFVQLIFGDTDGAEETQEHFLNEGLGSSQLRSAYFLVTGEPKKALQIQGKFFSNLEGVVDGTPIVGHVKGGLHLLAGDHEHGWSALKTATSTTGAVVGGLLGGPAGAIGGHFLTDVFISGTDAVLNGNQSQPHGLVDYLLNINKLKPGEHFDEIAGLILDGKAGKKVKSKRDWFNIGRFGHEESAESHELQPLLEKENSDIQMYVGMPKVLDAVKEETELVSDVPGPSQITQHRSPSNRHVEQNFEKRATFLNFVQNDLWYKEFQLPNLETDNSYNFYRDCLEKFQHDYYLDKLDINSLKNKLSYLTDNEKSLIKKHDFRTVNTEFATMNCFLCSLAGIMNTNVNTVETYLGHDFKAHNSFRGSRPSSCLKILQARMFIKYTISNKLNSIEELKTYLKSNVRKLENKQLLLDQVAKDRVGHSVILKYKMVKDNPDPVILLVDYQPPGFLKPDIPNPFRFHSFFFEDNINYFYINIIQLLK